VDFNNVTDFKCPVFIFEGTSDRTTPAALAAKYYEHIRAPKKQFFRIERASHDVMFDAPGVMLVDLVNDIRPLAQDHGARWSDPSPYR
jgi:pimeloyl-ACP methyl ester carboxylesterase